ncbi:hypothetical protein MASR2M79_21370 [Aminivibrio sp.]
MSGVLQLLTGGYVVHPLQGISSRGAFGLPLLTLAFGVLGVADFSSGLCGSIASRFSALCHVLAGAVFFGSFSAPEGTNVWPHSSIYNGSFLLPTLILRILTWLIEPRLGRITGQK